MEDAVHELGFDRAAAQERADAILARMKRELGPLAIFGQHGGRDAPPTPELFELLDTRRKRHRSGHAEIHMGNSPKDDRAFVLCTLYYGPRGYELDLKFPLRRTTESGSGLES